MAQNPIHFESPLLRIGSISFLIGVVMIVVSTTLHPSEEDPSNHPLVFAEYAHSDIWVAVHLGQFAGGMTVFAGGFGALYGLLLRSESSTIHALAWIGFAVAIMTASTIAILQAIDGIALKFAVDSWIAAPVDDKPAYFRVAEGIRWMEYGTNSIFRILQGSVAVIFGIAIAKSMLVSRWIGQMGVVVGAVTIYAGIEVAYAGFAYMNIAGLRGLSMMFYIAWVVILGFFMLRKAKSKIDSNIDGDAKKVE